MKTLLFIIAITHLFAGVASASPGDHDYLQAYSTTSQFPGGLGEALLLDSIGESANITLTDNTIIVAKKGVYFLDIGAQVRSRYVQPDEYACFHMWIQVNGDNIPNTAMKRCFSDRNEWTDIDIISTNMLLPLEAGDEIQVIIRSSQRHNSTTGVVFLGHKQQSPAASVTIFKL